MLMGFVLTILSVGGGCSDAGLRAELERQALRLEAAQTLFPEAHLNLGAKVFAQRCSACHGRDGRGAAAIPPLFEHVAKLTATEAGRSYAAGVVVHGINGEIQVGEKKYFNMMPGLGSQLDDEAIVGAINYAKVVLDTVELEPQKLLTTDTVKDVRKNRCTPQEHIKRRPSGVADKS